MYGQEQCVICFDGFEGDGMVREIIDCKHVFHEECLQMWWERQQGDNITCPLCNIVVTGEARNDLLLSPAMDETQPAINRAEDSQRP